MAQSPSTTQLIEQSTGTVQEIPNTGGEVTATGISDLQIDLDPTQILGAMQVGDDLVINLANGGQIIVRDFFAFDQAGEVLAADGSPVILEGEDGGNSRQMWLIRAGMLVGVAATSLDDDDGPAGFNPEAAMRALELINAYDGNNEAPSRGTYTDAGVAGVTDENLAELNRRVADSDNDELTAFNLRLLLTAANNELARVAGLATINAYDGNNEAPTTDTYSDAGVTAVTDDNLAELNRQVADSDDNDLTAEELQELVTAINAEMARVAGLATINAYDGENDAPTAQNYTDAGVTGVTSTNLEELNSRVAASEDTDLTAEEIQELVTAADAEVARVRALATINAYTGTNTAPDADDYDDAGVTGVTTDNLAELNRQVADSDDDDLTAEEIQVLVTAADVEVARLAALATINAYNGNNTVPDADDYAAAGVTGVTATNLEELNNQVEDSNDNDLTAEEIQELVTAANAELARVAALELVREYIDDQSNTAPDLATYQDLLGEGHSVTADNLEQVNEQVVALDDDEATQMEVEEAVATGVALAKINAYDAAEDIDASAIPTTQDYSAAGVENVSLGNLAGVNVRIAAESTTLDASAIQAVVDAVIGALDDINDYDGSGDPLEMDDYEAAGITGVTMDNISDLNDEVRDSEDDNLTVVAIQGFVVRVDALQTINAWDGSDDSEEPEVIDFTNAGIDDVTTDNLDIINERLEEEDTDLTADAIQALVREVIALALINAYDGGNNEPDAEDYEAAGVTGVTETNLEELNSQVEDSDDDDLTAEEIQELVTAANMAVALDKINAYEVTSDPMAAPTLEDYATLDVDDVTEDNLAAVNAQVASAEDDELTATEIQAQVTIVTDALETINEYNGGADAPEVDDYRTAGVASVTMAYLTDLNSEVADDTDTMLTAAEIRELLRPLGLATINDYDGMGDVPTVDDYAAAGVTMAFASRINLLNALVAASNGENVDITGDLLQHLVDVAGNIEAVLGIPPAPSAMSVTANTDADGTVESFSLTIDIDDDSTTDRSVEIEVNDDGIPTAIEYDLNNDSTVERRDSFTVNEDGQRTRHEIDRDGDGTTDSIELHEYDEDTGRLTEIQFDNNANETVDRRESYTYNDEGHVIRVTHFNSTDEMADPIRIETYELNHAGQRTTTNIDLNGSGTVNRIETYELNAAGHVLSTSFDTNANGTANRTETHELAPGTGHRTMTSFDTNADGTDDRIETYELNGAGQPTRTAFDTDADNTTDSVELYHYTDTGALATTIIDADGDNFIDRIEFSSGYNNGGAALTLQNSYPGLSLPGLANIVLHGSTASELTISSTNVQTIANGDTAHELIVQGNNGDTVNLTGNFTARGDADADGTTDTAIRGNQTYNIYDIGGAANAIGTILIDQDITVILPT